MGWDTQAEMLHLADRFIYVRVRHVRFELSGVFCSEPLHTEALGLRFVSARYSVVDGDAVGTPAGEVRIGWVAVGAGLRDGPVERMGTELLCCVVQAVSMLALAIVTELDEPVSGRRFIGVVPAFDGLRDGGDAVAAELAGIASEPGLWAILVVAGE